MRRGAKHARNRNVSAIVRARLARSPMCSRARSLAVVCLGLALVLTACSGFHGRDAPDASLDARAPDDATIDATDTRATVDVNARDEAPDASPEAGACAPRALRGDLRIDREISGVVPRTRAPWELGTKGSAVDRQGRILVYGGMHQCSVDGHTDAFVVRMTRELTLDPTFGTQGLACVNNGASTPASLDAYALRIDAHDRIVIAGATYRETYLEGFVARLSDRGTLDGTFGTGGLQHVRASDDLSIRSANTVLYAVSIDDDDGVLLAGSNGAMYDENTMGQVFRLRPDGTPDDAFANAGALLDPRAFGYYAIERAGSRFVVAGHSRAPMHPRVLRISRTGMLDETFGANGVATHPLGDDTYVRALELEPDGALVVAGGRSPILSDVSPIPVLLRFDGRGQPDLAFGSRGEVTVAGALFQFTYMYDSTLMRRCDGSYLLALRSGTQPALLHVDARGAFDESFGLRGLRTYSVATSRVLTQPVGLHPNEASSSLWFTNANIGNRSFAVSVLGI